MKFPKIDLHLHLDGSIRPETAWEMAKELGIDKLIAVGMKSRAMAEAAKGIDVLWFPTVEEI